MRKEDLKPEELYFLRTIVPWTLYLNSQTRLKAKIIKRVSFIGVYPSLVLADILIKSEFGKNPIAKEIFRGRQSNNLTLMPVDEVWSGDKTKFLGTFYKMFETWEDFFIHWSDLLIFRCNLQNSTSYSEQLNAMSSDLVYNEKILTLIRDLNLTEYDDGIEKSFTNC